VYKFWNKESPPKKILAIRYQALGDLVITLPYLQSIRKKYPETKLHLITRAEFSSIPMALDLFDKVIVIGGGRNAKLQFILSLLKLPTLLGYRYDVVLDLQNHRISKVIRKILHARAWVTFDRESPISAGERTRLSIEKCWTWKVAPDTSFTIPTDTSREVLQKNGWRADHQLIVLNPSGFCESRHWPIENYAAFAKLWLKQVNPQSQFILLLLPAQREKAQYLVKELGEYCIDLTGNANQVEAFSIIQKCAFVISEDSGLMHMAWVQGIPTLALFSSSRKDWSAPQGSWSYCFDSSDLDCGPCMLEVCKYGDNRCLTRVTPLMAVQKAKELL